MVTVADDILGREGASAFGAKDLAGRGGERSAFDLGARQPFGHAFAPNEGVGADASGTDQCVQFSVCHGASRLGAFNIVPVHKMEFVCLCPGQGCWFEGKK